METRMPLAVLALFLAACTGAPDDTGKAPADDTGGDTDTADPIVPGTETVEATWDVDLFSAYESPTIPRFDTLDGRRKLDGMTIHVEHTAAMTVAVANKSTFALNGADYSAEYYFQTIIQLGTVDADTEGAESPPFFGPGSFLAVVAEDLAADDGDDAGGDDQYVTTVTDTITFEAPYDWEETPTYLEAMIGDEPLQLVVGGFSEMWVYWNDDYDGQALLEAGGTGVRYAGTMTVTYAYSPAEE